MLYFTKHPEGPELPEDTKGKRFRSYTDMANWAEEHLQPGKYWARNSNGSNLAAAIREVKFKVYDRPFQGRFYVDGRGNI